MEWFGTQLGQLHPSYHRIKLPEPEHMVIEATGFEVGLKTMHVPPDYHPKDQVAIGIEGRRVDKPDKITRWAIIGPEPVAILEPQLAAAAGSPVRVRISTRGRVPSQHWIVSTGG